MICFKCGKTFNASKLQEDMNGNKFCSIECFVKMVTKNNGSK